MLKLRQLRADIQKFRERTLETRAQGLKDIETALKWLDTIPEPGQLRDSILPVVAMAKKWHGAIPTTDIPLSSSAKAKTLPPPGTTVIAVDGSQIYPDRHAAVLYYLIQVGGIIFRYNGQAPESHSDTRLYFDEHELYDEAGFIVSAQHIGQQRTLKELDYLAALITEEHRKSAATPVIALTDGPLLWAQKQDNRAANYALEQYLNNISRIQQAQGMPVGFIERPGGRLFIDLLWAGQLSKDDLPQKLEQNPLHYATDEQLMGHILKPGERTVWLQRPSATNTAFAREGHLIWCCYINIGEDVHYPVIARLETPAWAAQNPEWEELLHAVLIHQSHLLKGNPYVLARAHEIALVSTKEKATLDALLQQDLWQAGIPARQSEKARQKSYLSRSKT